MPPTTSAQALQAVQGFQSQIKAPQDILQQQQQQLGVPGQQQQVSGLRQAITNTTNLLNQVAPSVYGRTGGSLVTTAQAGRQVQNEQAPLATNLQNESTQYSGAQSDLDRALQQAQDAAGLEVTGQQQQLSNLQDVYKNLYQKEQDAASQELEKAKLAESQRQFNLTPRGGVGGINLGDLLKTGQPATASSSSAPKPANPIQQAAEGDVSTRLGSQSLQQILSDYVEANLSAKNGNQKDQYKIAAYNAVLPSLISQTKNTPVAKQIIQWAASLDPTRRSIISNTINSAAGGSVPIPASMVGFMGKY